MSATDEPRVILECAQGLLAEASLSPTRARATALLLRQALEASLGRVWAAKAPSLSHARLGVQLTCFAEYTSDETLVRETQRTWHALSEACHYRGFGMPPSRESLVLWAERVGRLVEATG